MPSRPAPPADNTNPPSNTEEAVTLFFGGGGWPPLLCGGLECEFCLDDGDEVVADAFGGGGVAGFDHDPHQGLGA